jgi:hypothetical protein
LPAYRQPSIKTNKNTDAATSCSRKIVLQQVQEVINGGFRYINSLPKKPASAPFFRISSPFFPG